MPRTLLARGANSLLVYPQGERIVIEAARSLRSASHEVDLFVAVVDESQKVASNDHLLYYNQPSILSGSASYEGTTSAGDRTTQRANLDLSRLAAPGQSVLIAVATENGAPLRQTPDLALAVSTPAGQRFEMPLEVEGSETSALAAEIYRRNGEWKVRSVWQGWNDGLPALLEHFGVDLADEGESGQAVALESTGTPVPDAAHPSSHRLELDRLEHAIEERRQQLAALERQIVETRETVFLQDVGIYEFAHPLDSAVQYKERLDALKAQYKELAKGRAVTGATNWAVNGSLTEGARMVREQCKLMLRAYNAEADNCVRTVRAFNLEPVSERLEKAKGAIERLGKSMAISITPEYHALRLEELRLAADYQVKVAEEKERLRAEREERREQERAEKELAEARAAFERERDKLQAALEIAQRQGDEAAIAEMQGKLEEAEHQLKDIENRQANFRAGYVYVISNLGAFGDRIVKIGMTRRMEPTERIRELSGAGVPFLYDVHALFFSQDALGLESRLHREFEHRRVNRINQRREFFYATPHEVLEAVRQLAGETVLEFNEEAEAEEFRRSLAIAKGE
ncbi:stress response protein SCP2/regulator of protease activity HflC (stomatin/prohibitin superfamily) [Sinomonas atrocyanea]|uniref:DUF4041 domain-containing protein n=1 Tax=Sinomonas atrocyanea TaxID=37927 RepID=UPI00278384E4|nr:DUF4041 domain-containing protein [Sinomonas atrocyanea]MDP9884443.1 stress response protein SCP2/regulator of protease activity HflC (stomatin/prohibitin superfamily) [Sinomonas atrocyanea]